MVIVLLPDSSSNAVTESRSATSVLLTCDRTGNTSLSQMILQAHALESRLPIAGGKNLPMQPVADVKEILNAPFDVLQPDLTKNAPLHVARELVEASRANDKRIVPHFLGSAPGQAASLHFAAGCPEGLVEMDINRNPLRTELCDKPFEAVDGMISIPDEPGIGWRLSH